MAARILANIATWTFVDRSRVGIFLDVLAKVLTTMSGIAVLLEFDLATTGGSIEAPVGVLSCQKALVIMTTDKMTKAAMATTDILRPLFPILRNFSSI